MLFRSADSVRHGTAVFVPGKHLGEDHPRAKLTQAQVERIMEIRAVPGSGVKTICRQLGLPVARRSAVHGVIMGRSWNHVTGLPPYVYGRPTKASAAIEDIQGRRA